MENDERKRSRRDVVVGRQKEKEEIGRAPQFSAMAPAILPHGVTSIKPCNLNVNISIRNDRA